MMIVNVLKLIMIGLRGEPGVKDEPQHIKQGRITKNILNSLEIKFFESCFSIVHSRFSTNTFPSWKLAQPFRFISHNGEINTLQGNLNSLKSAESRFESKLDEFISKI